MKRLSLLLFILLNQPALIKANDDQIALIAGVTIILGVASTVVASPFIINSLTTPSEEDFAKCLKLNAQRYIKSVENNMAKSDAQENFDYESFACDKGFFARIFYRNPRPATNKLYHIKVREVERDQEIRKILEK